MLRIAFVIILACALAGGSAVTTTATDACKAFAPSEHIFQCLPAVGPTTFAECHGDELVAFENVCPLGTVCVPQADLHVNPCLIQPQKLTPQEVCAPVPMGTHIFLCSGNDRFIDCHPDELVAVERLCPAGTVCQPQADNVFNPCVLPSTIVTPPVTPQSICELNFPNQHVFICSANDRYTECINNVTREVTCPTNTVCVAKADLTKNPCEAVTPPQPPTPPETPVTPDTICKDVQMGQHHFFCVSNTQFVECHPDELVAVLKSCAAGSVCSTASGVENNPCILPPEVPVPVNPVTVCSKVNMGEHLFFCATSTTYIDCHPDELVAVERSCPAGTVCQAQVNNVVNPCVWATKTRK